MQYTQYINKSLFTPGYFQCGVFPREVASLYVENIISQGREVCVEAQMSRWKMMIKDVCNPLVTKSVLKRLAESIDEYPDEQKAGTWYEPTTEGQMTCFWAVMIGVLHTAFPSMNGISSFCRARAGQDPY